MFGTNMFGDALRDLLDPKLRGGIGRFAAPGNGGARQKGSRSGAQARHG